MTELSLFSATEAALQQLKADYQEEHLPDVDDAGGYEYIRKGIAEIRSLRTKVEARRKELKAPLLKQGREIDAAAKSVLGELLALEGPMKAIKSSHDTRREREREEWHAQLREKIDAIRAFADLAKDGTLEECQEYLDTLMEIDVMEGFYDLKDEAIQALQDTREKVNMQIELKALRVLQDKQERELEELRSREPSVPTWAPPECFTPTDVAITRAIDLADTFIAGSQVDVEHLVHAVQILVNCAHHYMNIRREGNDHRKANGD